MGYRKLQADHLFDGFRLLPAGQVLITSPDGTIVKIIDRQDAGDDIETFPGILTPGFINTHCHLELSHMKGVIPSGTGLVPFLTRVIKERSFPVEEIIAAATEAEKQMYDSGMSAVADICNTSNTIVVKQRSKMYWQHLIEVIGFSEAIASARMNYATRLRDDIYEGLKNADGEFPAVSFVPHAPYSVSKGLFSLINAASAGNVISMHNQESAAEDELYKSKTGSFLTLYENLQIDPDDFEASGRSSLQTYLPWLNKASTLILVHNSFTQEEDILYAVSKTNLSSELYFCICINANRYIESVNPPLDLLRKHRCNITIGTDSLASNHRLDMIEEMKTIHSQFPNIALEEMLRWATANGAKALGQDRELGSFTAGKKPGIVLIENISNGHLTESSSSKRII